MKLSTNDAISRIFLSHKEKKSINFKEGGGVAVTYNFHPWRFRNGPTGGVRESPDSESRCCSRMHDVRLSREWRMSAPLEYICK